MTIEGIATLTNTVSGNASMGGVAMSVRVRFAPSPTGDIHVGNIRTALFNWAYARHEGGTFVFRVEDTDVERSTEASYLGVVDALNWLGLTWDEGPDVGGPYGPYKQSERSSIYADVAAKLAASPHAYWCYCTTEEVEARNQRSRPAAGIRQPLPRTQPAQVEAFVAQGRTPALRLRMPDRAITFDDLIRGPVTFEAEFVPDYVLVRADGNPLVHVGESGRRRAHAHHACAARRRPAVVDAAPDRAVRSARFDRRDRRADAVVRAPAVRDGGGQQEAVEARPRVVADAVSRPWLPAGGDCSTTSRSSAGRWVKTASCSACKRWSMRSPSIASAAIRPAST